jgi:hypothetical protein
MVQGFAKKPPPPNLHNLCPMGNQLLFGMPIARGVSTNRVATNDIKNQISSEIAAVPTRMRVGSVQREVRQEVRKRNEFEVFGGVDGTVAKRPRHLRARLFVFQGYEGWGKAQSHRTYELRD